MIAPPLPPPLQLPSSFPNLQHLRITCTPPITHSNSKTAGSSSSSVAGGSRPGSNAAAVSAAAGNIQQLQRELPLLLQKVSGHGSGLHCQAMRQSTSN